MKKIYEENGKIVCILTKKDKEKYRKFSTIPREISYVGENSFLYAFNESSYESFKKFLKIMEDSKYNVGDNVFVMSFLDKEFQNNGIHIKPYSNNSLAGYDTLYPWLVTLSGFDNSTVIHRVNIKNISLDKDGNKIYKVKTYASRMYPDGWIDITEEDILCKDECVNSDIINRLNGQLKGSDLVKCKVIDLVIIRLFNIPNIKNYDEVVNTIESIYEGFLDVIDKKI